MANDAFAALAHPTRREIVKRLSGGAATAGEASRDLGVPKPTISRHLKMLEEAGVVTRVIDGRTHRLALRPETVAESSHRHDLEGDFQCRVSWWHHKLLEAMSVLGEPALADGEVRNDPLDAPPEVLAVMGFDEVDELADDYVLDYAGREANGAPAEAVVAVWVFVERQSDAYGRRLLAFPIEVRDADGRGA